MTDEITLIVGLGNPGGTYARNRHNAGFWFVDMLAEQYGGEFAARTKLRGSICQIDINGSSVRLFKPEVFMNESGLALQAASSFYQISVARILVAHDEIDFPLAKVRLKCGGGHGGHNGLRDIIRHIGDGFWRLRIGIGHPGTKERVTPYVLGNAAADEHQTTLAALEKAVAVMPDVAAGDFDLAMNQLHL